MNCIISGKSEWKQPTIKANAFTRERLTGGEHLTFNYNL